MSRVAVERAQRHALGAHAGREGGPGGVGLQVEPEAMLLAAGADVVEVKVGRVGDPEAGGRGVRVEHRVAEDDEGFRVWGLGVRVWGLGGVVEGAGGFYYHSFFLAPGAPPLAGPDDQVAGDGVVLLDAVFQKNRVAHHVICHCDIDEGGRGSEG